MRAQPAGRFVSARWRPSGRDAMATMLGDDAKSRPKARNAAEYALFHSAGRATRTRSQGINRRAAGFR